MSTGTVNVRPAARAEWSSRQWWQTAWITAGACTLYVLFRFLPTGTNLNHMDFRVTGKGALELCDPSNPQFIPVIAAKSPVKMTAKTALPPLAGGEVRVTLRLETANGKPIAPEDVVVKHGRKLHLLIIDPTLTDYQHVHPEPGKVPGEWSFAFVPKHGGTYRLFADFTPAATNRSLYSNADLVISGETPIGAAEPTRMQPAWTAEQGGYRFSVVSSAQPIRAGQAADLKFTVDRTDGAPVRLEPVMEALAHLVAFDVARSGFAHLHPMDGETPRPAEELEPSLAFKVTIPSAGRFVIWAQVQLDGREIFVPFWFDVAA